MMLNVMPKAPLRAMQYTGDNAPDIEKFTGGIVVIEEEDE